MLREFLVYFEDKYIASVWAEDQYHAVSVAHSDLELIRWTRIVDPTQQNDD